jgi:hypothetical protein
MIGTFVLILQEFTKIIHENAEESIPMTICVHKTWICVEI